jgi:hypothetical protein
MVEAERQKTIKHFRDLEVYKRAFLQAMAIYTVTKSFPKDEVHFNFSPSLRLNVREHNPSTGVSRR